MQDFVTDSVSGLLLHPLRKRPIGNNMFALQHVQVGAETIVDAVHRVEVLSMEKRAALGAAARARYEQERDNFGRTMKVRLMLFCLIHFQFQALRFYTSAVHLVCLHWARYCLSAISAFDCSV